MKEIEKIEPIDLSEILSGYEDKWVVISSDYKKVIKFSDKFEDLKSFLSLGIVMLVPNSNYSFSPNVFI